MHISYQVAPEDCTGCGICVEVCPAQDKSNASRKAINMAPQLPLRETERENFAFFLDLPEFDRARSSTTQFPAMPAAVRVLRRLRRLRRDSLLKLLTQLFGDRLMIANATGCSSIYGGNLPTTPYTVNDADAARPGATRCSKTTPNSASACAPAADQRCVFAQSWCTDWPRSSAAIWSRV